MISPKEGVLSVVALAIGFIQTEAVGTSYSTLTGPL